MEQIRKAAMMAVGRAVFFGGFAITIMMLGLSFDFAMAFKTAAILTFIMVAVLIWFAQTAHGRKPEHSEVWILLAAKDKPNNDAARRVFHQVMQEVYLYYAARAFAIGAVFFAVALLMQLFGLEYGLS